MNDESLKYTRSHKYTHFGYRYRTSYFHKQCNLWGVETLWFMPLQPTGRLHRKGILGSYYSISDYVSLNPEYGVPDNFKLLVEEAHHYNMKVIIDWVANHTSWDHVWTQTHPDFFSKNESGNFHPSYPDWGGVIHLNYENKELWLA